MSGLDPQSPLAVTVPADGPWAATQAPLRMNVRPVEETHWQAADGAPFAGMTIEPVRTS